MHKAFLLTGLFLLLGTVYCLGENRTGKLRLGSDQSDYVEVYSPRSNGSSSITMGLRRNTFLNGVFFSNKQDGILTPGLGWTISYSYYVLSNLEIEAEMFYSSYHLNTNYIQSSKAMHQGLEFFGNLYVLPPLGEWTRIVCPYVGAGYQTSSIQATETKYSTGTGGFIAKGGIRFYLFGGFNARVESKQSLPVSSSKLFRSIEIGISLSM